MQYMLLIYGDEKRWASNTPESVAAAIGAYNDYTQELIAAGKLIGGSELAPVARARSVSLLSGAPVVVDGPYVDTKEQLGGYYLIEADSLDEAMAWAQKCPGARHGGIEVRPLMRS